MNDLAIFLTGLSVGASLIIAIGAQNAYVLRLGLIKSHVFWVALFCGLSDAVLIAAGIMGLGALVTAQPKLMIVIAAFGAAFLLWYGYKALMRVRHPQSMAMNAASTPSLKQALLTCALLTWANPHVYLDTVVLLGSLAAPYPPSGRFVYGAGAITASFLWFFALGYGARLLAPLFQRPRTWQVLDLFICLIMWLIAARLIVDFLL